MTASLLRSVRRSGTGVRTRANRSLLHRAGTAVPVEVFSAVDAGEGGFAVGGGFAIEVVVGGAEPAGCGCGLRAGGEAGVAGEALVPDRLVGRSGEGTPLDFARDERGRGGAFSAKAMVGSSAGAAPRSVRRLAPKGLGRAEPAGLRKRHRPLRARKP